MPEEVKEMIGKAWAPRTKGKYEGGWKSFMDFCDAAGIPKEDRLPASEMTLCQFAAAHAGSISGNTVRNKLHGIQSHHILHNEPYNYGRQLEYTLKGIDKLTLASSK